MLKSLTFSAGALALASPLIAAPAYAAPTAQITGFRASVNPGRVVSVSGKVAGGVGAGKPVVIDLSKNGRTGWQAAATVNTTSTGSFTSNGYNPYPWTYYRARFASAVSPTKRVGRTETRIIKYKVSPRKIKKPGYFSVGGVLQHKGGSGWKALKGRTVSVVFAYKGGRKLHLATKIKTDSKGRFGTRINAKKSAKDAYWLSWYAGDKTHHAAASNRGKAIFVDVR